MFGFIIGTISLIALIKVIKHGGFGGGWGGGRFGRMRWGLRWISRRLDLTPAQEKVFNEAVDDIEKQAQKLREEAAKSREDIAASLKGEKFDQSRVNEAFARQDAILEGLRGAIVGNLAKIHEALNDAQRREVGDLIEGLGSCGRRSFGGGCGMRPSFVGAPFSRV